MEGLAALWPPESDRLLASPEMPYPQGEQTPGPRAHQPPHLWDSFSSSSGIPWKKETLLVCNGSTSLIGHWILVHRAGVVAPEAISWCVHCPDLQPLAGPWG